MKTKKQVSLQESAYNRAHHYGIDPTRFLAKNFKEEYLEGLEEDVARVKAGLAPLVREQVTFCPRCDILLSAPSAKGGEGMYCGWCIAELKEKQL